jgi:uncharacterized protein (DUF302 family)
VETKMIKYAVWVSVLGIFIIVVSISSGCAKNCPEAKCPVAETVSPDESTDNAGSSVASVPLGYTKTLDGVTDIDQAVAKVTDALKAQGFGIMGDLDAQGIIKKKLDETIPPYRILGFCNPKLAFEALQKDKLVGMLLPCKVIIYQNEQGEIVVSFAKPTNVIALLGNPELDSVASRADEGIKRAYDAL